MAAVLSPDEAKLYDGQPKGFPFGDFDIEDVMLPEGDDMGIPSDDEDEGSRGDDLPQESGFGSLIVVDNLPQVPTEKYAKLTAILTKILSGVGRICDGGLHHPQDEATQVSKGFAFVEYENPQQAHAALDALNGYQLDKAHTFRAYPFDEFQRLSKVPDEYQEPESKSYEKSEDLQWWLNDKRGRDQFVTRYGDETDVYWNDPARQQPDEVYRRSFWSDAYVEWSPRGSFLATVHRQGVQLWGGQSFVRLGRVAHGGVQRTLFSPDERYLLTFSEGPGPRNQPMFTAKVSDVRTGQELRVFEGPQEEYAVGAALRPDGGMAWPAFRWGGGSDGGRFLAHMKKGALAIYDASQGMTMLDKKSVKLEGIQSFEWSPSAPVVCAYQSEQGNLPARVVLLRVPGKEEIRAKNLFSVAGIVMTWHPQGNYVAVQVDKWTKTRKSKTTNFEIFSLGEKDCPIDMLELPNKSEKIMQLAWEPHGQKFAVLHGEGSRPTLSIYTMKDTKGSARGATLLHSMPGKTATSLHWSPAGRFLLLAGLVGGMNGALEWWDCEDPGASSGVGVISANEHFMANTVEWDPTGRYLATIVSSPQAPENGFQIWSFAGQPLYKVNRERFFQLSWRPRPPSLLTDEQQREIARGLKKYSKRYEEEDEAVLMQADTELIAERERMMADWRKWHEGKAAFIEQQKRAVVELLGAKLKLAEDFKTTDAEVTVVVDTKEEPARLP